MSFNIGLAGIRAADSDLRVTGNNIANSSTTGFKRSRAEFGDVYSSSMVGMANNATGSGVRLQDIAQQFTQGNISFTDNVLDLSVDGSGFFIMSQGGDISYTRSGMFSTDNQGYVVNNSGYRLQGYSADEQGNIIEGALGDMQIDASSQAPRLTSAVQSRFNLDATEVAPEKLTQVLEPSDLTTTGLAAIELHTTMGKYTLADLLPGLTDTTPSAIAEVLNSKSKELGLDVVATASAANVSISLGDGLLLSRDGNGNGNLDTGEILPITNHAATFDAIDPGTYNSATSVTIYDSLGNPHVMTQYFVKQRTVPVDETLDTATSIATTANNWKMYVQIDGRDVGPVDPVSGESAGFAMRFGNDGRLHPSSQQAFLIDNWTPLDKSGNYNGSLMSEAGSTLPLPIPPTSSNFVINIEGSTQFASAFGVNDADQNGYTTGRLSGVSIDTAGVVFARFTNGQAQVLGQVALASFNNEQGLQAQGGTAWTETFESGSPLVGVPQTAALGMIQSGALEDSNVDLSEELVNLIIAQRNYQSNAKTIETADQVTQTILNI